MKLGNASTATIVKIAFLHSRDTLKMITAIQGMTMVRCKKLIRLTDY